MEFDKGVKPGELVKKYPLKYNTLMNYFEQWKHKKQSKHNPYLGFNELIKDLAKPLPKKPIETVKTIPEKVETPIKLEDKEIITDVKKVDDWKPRVGRERNDPFEGR